MNHSSNIIGFRTAFFFATEIERPDRYFMGLEKLIDEFDVMPTLQPLPQGLRTNGIPLMSFRSQNGMFQCDISLDRLDFFIRMPNDLNTLKFKQVFDIYKEISRKIADYIIGSTSLPVNRIGMVGDYFVPAANAVETVRLINSMPMEDDGLIELAIRKNKRKTIANLTCNDLSIYEAVQIQQGAGTMNGVMVTRDLNNVPQPGIVLQPQFVIDLLDKGAAELSEDSFKGLLNGAI
jgi:hypothetical protein